MSWAPSRYKRKSRGKNGLEYVVVCPLCSGDLHWNASLGGGQCFRCSERFNIIKMRWHFRETTTSVIDEIFTRLNRVEKSPPAPVLYSDYRDHWQAKWSLETQRKCNPETLIELGVWYDEAKDRVCIPIQPVGRDPGTERPHMSRHTDPDIKGWKAQPFGIPKDLFWFTGGRALSSSRLVLVEGIYDVLTPRLEGLAYATLGVKLTKEMQMWFWEHSDLEVVLWYDPDFAGKRGGETIYRQLNGVVKKLTVIEDYPEPGDLSPQEVREILGV